MKLRLCIYFFKTAFNNIKNNRLVHMISIGTISISMLLLGSFLLLSVNISNWLSDWGGALSMSVYIEDGMKAPGVKLNQCCLNSMVPKSNDSLQKSRR